MSTLWFERHADEVHGVENNSAWYDHIKTRADKAKIYLLSGQDYVDKLNLFPYGYFDVISIDGSSRLKCFQLALGHIPRGGVLVVDNTDNDRTTGGDLLVIDRMIDSLGSDWEVHRFPGWGPGNFFAWETTLCLRR